tara:strand:+ start:240 stop:971 length:732 start_codon:yes stop_codon:yes gene_type:complete
MQNSKKKNKDISFIFCVFNEYPSLNNNLKRTIRFISKKKYSQEIIIIDNNSTDGSREFIKSLNFPNLIKIYNNKNIGKGGSTRKAIKKSKGKYLIIYDIDNEYKIEDCYRCYDHAKKTESNLVIGSRVYKKNFIYMINYLGVIFLSKLVNILFQSHLTDVASMPKLVEKKFYDKLNFISNGFDFDFELITKSLRLKAKITQIDVIYSPRSYKEGKKIRAFKDGILCMIRILKDRFISLKKVVK